MITPDKPFQLSERRLVKELHSMLYAKDSENRYRLDGIPKDDFLEKIRWPALKRATTRGTVVSEKELEAFRKVQFYLESCVEQGFVRVENGKLKLTGKGNKFISWHYWVEPLRDIIPIIIAVISLAIAVQTAYYTGKQANALQRQIDSAATTQSASFLVDLNNQLRNGPNSYSSIIYALSNRSSLKGFSDEEKDDYLMMWELVDQLIEHHLIDQDSAYDAFSYDVEQAYCSPDIKQFVLETRKLSAADSDDYGGFTNLAHLFLTQDNNEPCSPSY